MKPCPDSLPSKPEKNMKLTTTALLFSFNLEEVGSYVGMLYHLIIREYYFHSVKKVLALSRPYAI